MSIFGGFFRDNSIRLYKVTEYKSGGNLVYGMDCKSLDAAILHFLTLLHGASGHRISKENYDKVKNLKVYVYSDVLSDCWNIDDYSCSGPGNTVKRYVFSKLIETSKFNLKIINDAAGSSARKHLVSKAVSIIKAFLNSYPDKNLKKTIKININSADESEQSKFYSGLTNDIDIGGWNVYDYTKRPRDEDEYAKFDTAMRKFEIACNKKLAVLQCKITFEGGDWDDGDVTLCYRPNKSK